MLWKDTGLVWKMQAIPIWSLEKGVGVWVCSVTEVPGSGPRSLAPRA